MKKRAIKSLVLLTLLCLLFLPFIGRGSQHKRRLNVDEIGKRYIQVEEIPDLSIHEGFVSFGQDTLLIKRNEVVIGRVILSEPVMVAQSDREEEWGYFQFPTIYKSENGKLIVEWQMSEDSYKAYGKGGIGGMMSDDEGNTWKQIDGSYFRRCGNVVELRNGDILRVTAQPSKDVSSYDYFPKPVNKKAIAERLFYRESELPDDLRGNYITRWNRKTGKTEVIHGTIDDQGLLRYAIDGKMPLLWLGDIKQTTGDTLVSGIYPAYYLGNRGEILNTGVSFYRSADNGHSWTKVGTIPYRNSDEDVAYNGTEEGFNEPAFEILKDGTLLCVMRTGFYTPMYKCYSKDGGYHWSTPEPFTSNGVSPELLLLDNGVLVLSSGRPGVQIRFNIDGDGDKWTEPIEMLPFMDENGKYADRIRLWPTCGYTSLMAVDDHTFYFVWSDFTRKNKEGIERKTIMFRSIEILKEDDKK